MALPQGNTLPEIRQHVSGAGTTDVLHPPATSEEMPLIGGLPSEILYHILGLSIDVSPAYYSRLCNLRLVCRHWKDIINTSPELWSIIVPGRQEAIDIVLDRCQNHPLTITNMQGTSPASGEDHASFVHRMCDNIIRWRDVALEIKELPANLPQRLTTPAPLLEYFVLTVASVTTVARLREEPQDLFSGEAPRLRTLQLSSLPVKWHSVIFQSLNLLTIGWVPMRIDELLAMIFACPTLSSLYLRHITLRMTRSVASGDTVVHDQLRKLHLFDVSPKITLGLLSQLRLPRCEWFRYDPHHCVGVVVWDEFWQRVLAALPNVFQSEQAVNIRQMPQEYIKISSGDVDDPNKRFEALVQDASTPITEVIRSASVGLDHPPLSIDLYAQVKDIPGLVDVEDPIEGVNEVCEVTLRTRLAGAMQQNQQANAFLQRLWQPEEGKTYKAWPLPNLARLTLVHQDYSIDELTKMVDTRYSTEEGKEKAPVVSLQVLELQLCHCDDWERDILSDCIKPGKVLISSL